MARAQLVVAVQEVADGPLGHRDTTAGQFAVDLGDGAVFGMTQASDQGENIQAELVVGQSKVGLGFGTKGPEKAWTVGVGAAADVQG